MATSSSKETVESCGWEQYPLDYLDGPQVFVAVGSRDNRKEFHVHQALLCHFSGYVRGTLASQSVESTEQKIVLNDVNPDVFKLLNHWIYTGQLMAPDNMEDAERCYHWCLLWILGSRMVAPRLQNDVVNSLCQTLKEDLRFLNLKVVQLTPYTSYIWANTAPDSSLRSLIAGRYAHTWRQTREYVDTGAMSSGLVHQMQDLCRTDAFAGHQPSCFFHVHDEDATCYEKASHDDAYTRGGQLDRGYDPWMRGNQPNLRGRPHLPRIQTSLPQAQHSPRSFGPSSPDPVCSSQSEESELQSTALSHESKLYPG